MSDRAAALMLPVAVGFQVPPRLFEVATLAQLAAAGEVVGFRRAAYGAFARALGLSAPWLSTGEVA